ncbi:hypothetical protein NIES25_48100 [Nostoc linckia NIES-25]|nr:hypothetical protein NIES25_48100 [Nostoc linckia NIES-25]
MHFDIKDGKWVQQNLSDRNLAEELAIVGVTPDILFWVCKLLTSINIQIMA